MVILFGMYSTEGSYQGFIWGGGGGGGGGGTGIPLRNRCHIVISLNRVGCGLGCSHIQFTFHFGCCDNVKLGLVSSCCLSWYMRA